MKMKYIAVILLFFSINVSAQGLGSLTFINNLGNREVATFGDAVHFFVISMNGNPGRFKNNVNRLKGIKIIEGETYAKGDKLRRGMLAIMIARYLKLGDSLFYKIFKTERYAFRACVAEEIMQSNQSEWDVLSGDELIEIMAIIDEVRGVEK